MRKAFKYRIYLTKGQRRILEQQLEECRWVYNETLAYCKNAYEAERRTAHWYETKRLLPLWKATRPALKHVHSQVLQNVTESCNVVSKHCDYDSVGWGGIPLKPKPSGLGAVTKEVLSKPVLRVMSYEL